MNQKKAYHCYWGKISRGEEFTEPYHLLPYHCLDVAAVGQCLLSNEKPLAVDLAEFLGLSTEQLNSLFTFMLALHDIGKFASAFQGCSPVQYDELIVPSGSASYDSSNYRHDRLGFYFWTKYEHVFCDWLGVSEKSSKRSVKRNLDVLINCVLGHHGKPISIVSPSAMKHFTEPQNIAAFELFVEDLLHLLQPDFPVEKLVDKSWTVRLKQVSWQLAGIAVLADWIGSNCEHFPYVSQPVCFKEYWAQAQEKAIRAVERSGMHRVPSVAPFKSVEASFNFQPTPLQAWAEQVEVDSSPQLFILEDVTGAGKTEAALVLAHRLMEAGAAHGFYFGLPTMATSNAMFDRVAKHYLNMVEGYETFTPSIVLAHGARDMNERFQQVQLRADLDDSGYGLNESSATGHCNEWLADSRKKALLASVGVGTIDQALLAVLPLRHQSLRLLGLHRKVLVFDEVHAADSYMLKLLEQLLTLHLHQGGSAILLTATLSQAQRQALVNVWRKAAGFQPEALEKNDFPLATRVSVASDFPVLEQPLNSRAEVSRKVGVKTLHSEQACLEKIVQAVSEGLCVVWVRNTVDEAISSYRQIIELLDTPDNCTLFHSRFTLHDRKRIETQVLDTFGKSSDSAIRQGKVLISTQVFQESLDADADVMISDICLIDDLLQRAGRLHRHTRDVSGNYLPKGEDQRNTPVLYVHAPKWDDDPASDWLTRQFRNTEFIYGSPGRLWLGLRELRKLGAIEMPANARQLIESVYSEARNSMPEVFKDKEIEYVGKELGKSAQASSREINLYGGYSTDSSVHWVDDDCEISTRLCEYETVTVLLLKLNGNDELVTRVEHPDFAVALSSIKIAKQKYADNLAVLTDEQKAAVHSRYRQSQHLQLWLPEQDPQFTYCSVKGFIEKDEK